MDLKTDSRTLKLSGCVRLASSRNFFACDILVDGALVCTQKGELSPSAEEQHFSVAVEMGDGTKCVKILFPWSVGMSVSSFELDDGASVEAIKKSGNALVFGDSITQGYDASIPSRAYAANLEAVLNVNVINKAIGGEFFWPELAARRMRQTRNTSWWHTAPMTGQKPAKAILNRTAGASMKTSAGIIRGQRYSP